MRVRTSSCGALIAERGRLIWDDYLEHRQHALRPDAERILGWFRTWREIDSIEQMADPAGSDGHGQGGPTRLRRAAALLLHHGVLIAEDSPRHRREQDIEEQWGAWGPHTRAFHFATRSLADAPYISVVDDNARLATKLREAPPPSAFLDFPEAPRIGLPEADHSLLRRRDLIDVLRRRRSYREFDRSELSQSSLATLLKIAAGPLPHTDGKLAADSQSVFKTSPSGGARHPTEAYVYALRVAGLQPGVYHYHSPSHALEDLGRSLDPAELAAACGDQDWVTQASALVIYTSRIARTAWKYDMGRAYRAVLLDVGHLSQTVFLLATALELRAIFIGALRDELFERLIGCDPAKEIVIGASVIGTGTVGPA